MANIIVHPGKAHLDDMLSCAILIAHDAIFHDDDVSNVAVDYLIERREPTSDEVEYNGNSTFIVDVGGTYDPHRGLFDHHQLPRGSRDCAMTLLASSLAMPGMTPDEYEPAKPGDDLVFPKGSFAGLLDRLFRWFRVRAEVDSCGPFAAAKSAGTEWGSIQGFMGPCEGLVLAAFERDPLGTVVPLAEMIVSKVRAFAKVSLAVKVDRPWWGDGDFSIIDFTAADPAAVEEVSGALTPANGVAIFHDNRGDGLTILRLGDDPRVDLTRVREDPEVTFCHNGGFIAKTRSKDLNKAWNLIEGAYCGE